MSSNVLLRSGAGTDYGNTTNSQQIDLARGGTFGYAPDYANIQNNQPWLRHQGVLFLTKVPGIFRPEYNILSDADMLAKSLQSLLETRPQSIEGHEVKMTSDVDEVALSRDGSMFYEVSKGTNRTRISPSFTWGSDLIGRPIANMIDNLWIRIGINDPDTGYALLHSIKQEQDQPTRFALSDMYACEYLFVQPDHTGFNAEYAVYVINAWPKAGVGNKVTVESSHIGIEAINLEFTGMGISNMATRAVGDALLKRAMGTSLADPEHIPLTNDGGASLDPEKNLPPMDVTSGEIGSYKTSVENTRVGVRPDTNPPIPV